jgi:hypothetical protein
MGGRAQAPAAEGTIGKAVAQAVQADGLADPSQAGGGMAGATTSGRASNDSLALRGLSVLHSAAFFGTIPLRLLRLPCFDIYDFSASASLGSRSSASSCMPEFTQNHAARHQDL